VEGVVVALKDLMNNYDEALARTHAGGRAIEASFEIGAIADQLVRERLTIAQGPPSGVPADPC
jgi:hypothetical protein